MRHTSIPEHSIHQDEEVQLEDGGVFQSTPISKHLIHDPDEVERDGRRFDYLCRLAEEVAAPIVKRALFREYHETATAGAEILSEETKNALEVLLNDATILVDLDEETVIQNLQNSLSDVVPAPDEEECHQHTRDFSQILMSTWIETLRRGLTELRILELSDYLFPVEEPGRFARLKRLFAPAKSELPETVMDAVASFAVKEKDVGEVLSTLRQKLFAEPRLVDLPFDLVIIGAPAEITVANAVTSEARVLAMPRSFFQPLYQMIEQSLPKAPAPHLRGFKGDRVHVRAHSPAFVTSRAQVAAEKLTFPLPADGYLVVAGVASLAPVKLEGAELEKSVRSVAAAI